MMLFRSANAGDLDAIHTLAQLSGIGMTTLPKDKDLLQKRLQWSCDSFKRIIQHPHDEYYFLSWKTPPLAKSLAHRPLKPPQGMNCLFIHTKYQNGRGFVIRSISAAITKY